MPIGRRKQIQVLICTQSGRIGTASRVRKFDYRINNWYETENFEWNKSKLVTHWMPLPEPPKEEKDA